MPISTVSNTKTRLSMLCLSGFELYSRWVPLSCLLATKILHRNSPTHVQKRTLRPKVVVNFQQAVPSIVPVLYKTVTLNLYIIVKMTCSIL